MPESAQAVCLGGDSSSGSEELRSRDPPSIERLYNINDYFQGYAVPSIGVEGNVQVVSKRATLPAKKAISVETVR